ncbi:tetratricopeptide repeat protein [Marinobacter alexandrii]|jgi:tetratricopeptide (TPR) repeat protein|uniref:tetratricopeptide repeat protein n=1 Tax=Marinobacter alexandrii TaxID=2570351 RepID=UPI002ABDEACF|nr:tetratricopeptide repeat protein [Marinobacter alexandrii]
MKFARFTSTATLFLALAIGLAGCGRENEMSQEEIQYLSHLDQALFFQDQGELKASTLEARSAIELQPGKVPPYFIIIRNLLAAGDAINAEHQLNRLLQEIPKGSMPATQADEASLISAEAQLMQGQFEDALSTLDLLTSPDLGVQLDAALLRGRIHLARNNVQLAEQAFLKAESLDNTTSLPLVGLSRVAYARSDPVQVQAYVDKAERIDPNESELWLWKAQLAHSEGQLSAAEDAYIRALEDIGQYDVMTYRKYKTISALIDVLRAQGKSSEAYIYEEILARSAPGTIKSNLTAASKAYQGGDMESASRYLKEILALAPGHQQSTLMLGMVKFRQGRMKEAEALLSPIVSQSGSDTAKKLLAATRLQLQDTIGAREILGELDESQNDPEVLALVGIVSLASGESSSGRTFIDKSLSLRPDNHELRLRYASFLLQNGDPSAAIQHAQYVLASNQYEDQARLLLLRANIAKSDLSSAVQLSNAWLEEQPDNIAALIARGQLAARDGNNTEAMKYFDEAAKKDPESAEPAIAAGNLALQLSNQSNALKHFKKALRLSPNNSQALVGLSGLMKHAELTTFMKEILSDNPDAHGPKAVLLELALSAGNREEAEQLTAALLERVEADTPSRFAPLVADIYHSIATRELDSGHIENASRILDRGRALFPDDQDIALQAAALAFQQGNVKEARENLMEVKREHPDSPLPLIVEAAYFSSQKQHQEAAEMLKLALEKKRSASTVVAYARALQQAGHVDKGIESLEKSLEVFPDDPQLLVNLALLYQASEREKEAIHAYEQVLKHAENNVLALNNLAWLYHQNNDNRALGLARRAFDLNSENASITDTYGWILFTHGEVEDSVKLLEKAHQLQPDSAEIVLHLAEVYRATDQPRKAREVLNLLEKEE